MTVFVEHLVLGAMFCLIVAAIPFVMFGSDNPELDSFLDESFRRIRK